MKTYNELESLGFFEWLSETHNLKDNDMTPEYLDKLPLNDIHRTVCNSMAFKFFREKYNLISSIYPLALLEDTKKWCYEISNFETSWDEGSDLHSPEEAELECLKKLIQIIKEKL